VTLTARPEPALDASTGLNDDTRSLARNALALFGGQLVGMVGPMLTIPYLARVLGPEAWAPILVAQGLANWLMLVLEFGFDLSGTRAVARARTAPETMSDVVNGTQSAKLLLAPIAALIALGAFMFIPALRGSPALTAWTLAFAVLRGLSPLWFFQGIERVQGAVLVDALTKAGAAAGVLALVHSPSDGWRVLALQAVFAALSLAILTRRLWQTVPFTGFDLGGALRTLRSGGKIFACRASSGVYIQANAVILSALASASTVAFFGGAERIIRAAINLLQPLTQAFLPRVSFLQSADPAAARRTIRHSLVGLGLIGAVMGTTALVGAPLLVRIFLGAGYESAVPVLRLFSALPLLVSINTVLGVYWALPFGHDRAFLVALVSAGLVNIAVAAIAVPRMGAIGMAVAAVAAEVMVLLQLGVRYIRDTH
jgi:PST family polysaccharide transporter